EEVDRVANLVAAGRESSLLTTISNLTASRAETFWASIQHTSVDVGMYAFSNSPYLMQKVLNTKDGLAGFHENIDFSVFIKSIAEIDLGDVTEKIADIAIEY
ncbi:hypothetical protein K4G60_g5601, partial [Candida parapsilosis]